MGQKLFNHDLLLKAIDDRRKSLDLDWCQVAKQSGVSRPVLSRIKRGQPFSIETASKLARWSGASLDACLPPPTVKGRDLPPTLVEIGTLLRNDPRLDFHQSAVVYDLVKISYRCFTHYQSQPANAKLSLEDS